MSDLNLHRLHRDVEELRQKVACQDKTIESLKRKIDAVLELGHLDVSQERDAARQELVEAKKLRSGDGHPNTTFRTYFRRKFRK